MNDQDDNVYFSSIQWVDFDLASAFCENNTPTDLNIEYYSFIVGNGLPNPKFITYIDKVIHEIKNSNGALSPSKKNALIILFGYMARTVLKGCLSIKQKFISTFNEISDEVNDILKILGAIQIDEEKSDTLLTNNYLSIFASCLSKIEEDFQNKINQNQPYSIFSDISPIENEKDDLMPDLEQYRTAISNYANFQRKEKLISMKRYNQLFSQLSSNNGPWMTPENPPILHYKHDNIITRARLMLNTKFNDHKDASLARDIGSYENAQAIINEQIAKSKMKTFTADFSMIDFGDAEEEKNVEKDIESNQKELMICQSQLITPKKLYSGQITLTTREIIFDSASKFVKIPLKNVQKILFRRYLFIDTAVEVFTSYSKVYFINFFNDQERLNFVTKISSLKIPSIKFIQKKWDDIKPLVKTATRKWQNGEISNFDFLMKINILAGRSFNDLAQYPVFPWILSDYSSETIHLDDPSIYRDLTKPLGAIGLKRLEIVKERMDASIGDETRYLYGALYSSPAVVIGYLIRMEPFTSLHLQLQSNRFDVADRLFVSIPAAYESVTNAQMDFRELIPEFFIIPDFLRNTNHFDLGHLAVTKEPVDHVKLPPWANNSSRQFIEMNKRALESNYVTCNLHYWIDLMFGPHSRPPLSFEKDNVFSPSFYETAIENADEAQLEYLKEYAACFGCACLKVFDEFPESANRPHLIYQSFVTHKLSLTRITDASHPILCLNTFNNDILAISDDLSYSLNENKGKFSCAIPNQLKHLTPLVSTYQKNIAIGFVWSSDVNLYTIKNGNCELFADSRNAKTVNNNITAISVSSTYIAEAFSDYTLRVFEKNTMQQVAILSKHSRVITFTIINEPIGNVYSISKDGLISSISLYGGRFIKSIDTGFTEPSQFTVSHSGYVIVSFNGPDYSNVVVYDQNLEYIGKTTLDVAIKSWTSAYYSGNELILIYSPGKVFGYRLPYITDQNKIFEYNTDQRISAISYITKPSLKGVIGTLDGLVASFDI